MNELYDKLVRDGAAIFKKGHWIPASSLAYSQTLTFVLKNKDEDHGNFGKVCYRLW